jgi:dUTP pyrophosphatase
MEIKFKKLHENAVLPSYAKEGDAGLDLTATSAVSVADAENGFYYVEYGTGLAVEIPQGYFGYLLPRSSISKTGLIMANPPGLIDSGYRGEIKMRFKIDGKAFDELADKMAKYGVGDKIGQLMILPYPQIEPTFADELSTSERGAGGFGSTGK